MRPRFALGMIYVMAFFALYCVALITPQLWHVLQTVPTGPEQERVAQELAKRAIQPRLLLALGLAIGTTAIGMAKGWLPGTRPPV